MKLFKKRKFKILKNDSIEYKGHTLYRIQALKDFGYINKGDIGGYVEYDFNLSQHGNCWIYNDAKVFGRFTLVFENAKVGGNAKVYGNVLVYDNAFICGNATVFGNAMVYERARVYENARVYDNSKICGVAHIHGYSTICGNAKVSNKTAYIVFKN